MEGISVEVTMEEDMGITITGGAEGGAGGGGDQHLIVHSPTSMCICWGLYGLNCPISCLS